MLSMKVTLPALHYRIARKREKEKELRIDTIDWRYENK